MPANLNRMERCITWMDDSGGTNFIQAFNAAFDILEQLDERLASTAYLCGARRGLADIAIFPFIRQFANADRAWFDALDLPALQKWLEGLLASDLFAGVMQKHPQWKPAD